MAMGQRFVSDAIDIMRIALGRRNTNDPDSTDGVFFGYINNFVSLKMSDDVKLFEQFDTLSFTIDQTTIDGIYTFNDVGASFDFVNISGDAFISLLNPVNNSVSWNRLPIFQDPGQFYRIWGINNEEILIRGYPTMMLYYGSQMVFRTLPQTQYLINIYGYKKNNNYSSQDDELQYDYWLRYIAYGASLDYAKDYRYASDVKAELKADFASERKYMLTHEHNQIKRSRATPQY